MPTLSGILETALHVEDLERSAKFYEDVFGLRVIAGDTRFRAYSVNGRQVLLLFRREENPQPCVFSGGTIPPHGSSGEIHFAFAIERAELGTFTSAIRIATLANWPRGAPGLSTRQRRNWQPLTLLYLPPAAPVRSLANPAPRAKITIHVVAHSTELPR
jgi:catechol 2,3-dioxygenase-like lactoylglutathione lyase family enzyme